MYQLNSNECLKAFGGHSECCELISPINHYRFMSTMVGGCVGLVVDYSLETLPIFTVAGLVIGVVMPTFLSASAAG